MIQRLFQSPVHEPSRSVAFGGNVLDRQSELRSDDAAEKALAEASARLLLMHGGRLYMKLNGEALDPFFDVEGASTLQAVLAQAVLLGHGETGPVLAVPAGVDPDQLAETFKAIDVRSVYVQGLLAEPDLGSVAQGAALLAWHANHRFCGRCGHETDMRAGGYKRACPNCGTEHFPRTDPVAIMLAVRQDRCLMGRSRHFAPGMYSALAGFIEPGETIEDAVRRETHEEAGIEVGAVRYLASQPWPFPASLMIGCLGEALSEDITLDRTELEDGRWFSRDEVRLMLERRHPGELTPPPPMAIAHHLIRRWVEDAPVHPAAALPP